MSSSLSLILAFLLAIAGSDAATITVINKCSYTVWPAAIPVGGGTKLDPGQTWAFQAPAGQDSARVWGRTGCKFDGSGSGSCTTGDCGGVLSCTGNGKAPASLAEYKLGSGGGLDFYDVSLVDGFNVPISIGPAGPTGGSCHTVTCSANINAQCPSELKVDGGCASACLKFNAPQYCCPPPATPETCPPTDYSRFFKKLCPDAYSYAYDDKTSTFTCAPGANYVVIFCP